MTVLLLAALVAAGCRPKPRPAPSPAPRPASSQPPRILAVRTDPPLPVQEGGWHVLPPGSGVVTLRVQARNATRVRVYLVPMGTEERSSARLLGEDREGADGSTVVWRYPDVPLTAHVLVQAEGPGGLTEDESLQVLHDEAAPPR